MARRRDPETEELMARAVELKARRFKTWEIVEKIGKSDWVVRKLIRDAGGVPSTRELVVEKWPTGSYTPQQLATELRVDLRTVNGIIREEFGPRRKTYTVEENVERFLADPPKYRQAAFTKTSKFGEALVYRCLSASDESPKSGGDILTSAEGLFLLLRKSQAGEGLFRATCHLLQIRGMEAFRLSQLGHHEVSWAILRENYDNFARNRCDACETDYRRRLGLILGEWTYAQPSKGAWQQARKLIDMAIARYSYFEGKDHDVLGNGLAHCYLDRAFISIYSVGPQAALIDARKGLEIVNPAKCEKLHHYLLHAMAAASIGTDMPEEVRKARSLIQNQIAYFGMAETVPVMRTQWVAGLLAAKDGDIPSATDHLSYALDIAFQQELRVETAAIAAALGAIHADPRDIRGLIEGVLEADGSQEGSEVLVPPPWLTPPLVEGLFALFRASEHFCSDQGQRIRQAAKELRATASAAAKSASCTLFPEPA